MSDAASLFVDIEPGARVAETLLDAGVIDAASARRARQVARASGQSVVAVIHQLALADDARVVEALSRRFQIARAGADEEPSTAIELNGVNVAFLRTRRVLPLGWREGRLLTGVIDPEQSDGLAALSFAANAAAEPRLMSVSEQRAAFDRLYGLVADETTGEDVHPAAAVWSDDAQRMRDETSAGPAARLVDALLEQALEQNASDIHIEPLPDRVRVRFRIDGELTTVREEAAELAAPMAARIKVLADMDIADRRRAQDGRTSLAAKGRPVDVRISTVPSAYGEAVAMRLLRRDAALLDLKALGFAEAMVGVFEQVMQLRRGLFLLTGPTGSGKTTTLYAMIEQLRRRPLKVLSIEDPIEYFFADITQVQTNEDAGLTFPTALRAFLRQDPDIILIGEIRDGETARIAVQAALTGHLVLATLHTSDAAGAIPRLIDMGVDRFLIAATLAGAASQRLLRQLCQECRSLRAPSAAETRLLREAVEMTGSLRIGEAAGCPACRGAGVRGRIGVAEGFIANDAVRAAIAGDDAAALSRAMAEAGLRPLERAAAELAAEGRVSLAEFKSLAFA